VFQLGIAVPENIEATQSMSVAWLPWLIIIVAAYVVIFAALLVARRILRKRHREAKGLKKVVLLVTVPKEAADVSTQGNKEATSAEIKEKIGAAESLFAALGGLSPEHGIKAWFVGREDEVSFEVVMHEGLIHFYVAMPERLRDLLEEQIHANYPHADIEEADDYNIFTPSGAIAGAWMVFKRPTYFPIKTYQKQEIDPLSNITNALATIAVPDGAAIQLVVRGSIRLAQSCGKDRFDHATGQVARRGHAKGQRGAGRICAPAFNKAKGQRRTGERTQTHAA
jgi:hypothetical protein